MAVELRVPEVGESIAEVQVARWLKGAGDAVLRDENVVVIETDKATVEVPSPVDGVLAQVLVQEGEVARAGQVLATIDEGAVSGGARAAAGAPGAVAVPAATPSPPAPPADAQAAPSAASPPSPTRGANLPPSKRRALAEGRLRPEEEVGSRDAADRREEVVPMTLLRRRVAERLLEAQHSAALLTTFNEVDMSAVMDLRQRHRDAFQEKHGVKLGMMGFFVKAAVEALTLVPQVNAEIRDDRIVLRHYCDIGIAVGGGRGLVVPVLRNAERLTLAGMERAIADFGRRARDNKLSVDELQGGTFTITNGGIYGSLLSTPIINPPQSGILGMHAIQDRPVARDGQVVIRPMMYVALTYDHRLVDGREAVTFLKRIKDCVEDPARLLLEV